MTTKRKTLYDGDTFEHEGFHFKVRFDYDGCAMGRPWENADGHGPVREVISGYYERPKKRPGERFLNNDPGDSRTTTWAYDWQEAMRLAAKDGWGLCAEGKAKLAAKLGREPTLKEQQADSVEADFKFLAGWVNDDWHYVYVEATLMDENEDGDLEEVASTKFEAEDGVGVEDWKDYHVEAAYECAGNIIHGINKAISDDLWAEMAAAREVLERRYFAERDMVTV